MVLDVSGWMVLDGSNETMIISLFVGVVSLLSLAPITWTRRLEQGITSTTGTVRRATIF
jgi:hypothetical protein